MDIRYSCNQRDFKRYTTEEMRDEMLITGLYKADEVVAVYSHVDRMVTLGCMPVHETTSSALYRPVMSISSRISSVV
jgi:4-deoxy-L-threo-5-hexosulose-uronate ketol-isomerase